MDYKKYIASKISIDGLTDDQIYADIVSAPKEEMGDYALPCFKFSRALRKSPVIIAEELAQKIERDEIITKIEAVSGYLNFTINKKDYSKKVIEEVLSKNVNYGKSQIGNGKTICIDYSSVNIAKPFHMGHLSTTVIGGALVRIYNHLGYKTVGINHLGDFGTQFGKLITAYKMWGNRKDIEENGVDALQTLYVKFNDEAEKDESLNDEGRKWFKKIEDGDSEAVEIFEWFKRVTLAEVEKIYETLDIHFDSYAGESFYNDKMQPIIDTLNEKGLLVESQGAKIVDLTEFDMAPCIIVKNDGATLYATRDLAAAVYRKKTYDFEKCLYVVAYQQNLHFKQVFKVLELMGYQWSNKMEHVAFGMVSINGQSLSTRKGRVVYLKDVIEKCVVKAKSIIEEKNPDLENIDDTAQKIGVGAVIFSALFNNRIKDVDFNYDRVLTFDGETGPYVQYTYARCKSVLKKAELNKDEIEYSELTSTESALIKSIESFKKVVVDAATKNEPSIITRNMVEIAKLYNKFYYEQRIICDNKGQQNFRLALTNATAITLKTGLGLLGIKVPEKM